MKYINEFRAEVEQAKVFSFPHPFIKQHPEFNNEFSMGTIWGTDLIMDIIHIPSLGTLLEFQSQ